MESTIIASLLIGKFGGSGGDAFPKSFCLVNEVAKTLNIENSLNGGELLLERRSDSSS